MQKNIVSKTSPLDAAKQACMPGFIATGAFSFILNLLVLTGPIFMLQVYDRVLSSKSIPTLVGLSILAVGLYIFYGLFDGLRGRLLANLGALFDAKVRGPAFDATANNQTPALADVDQVRTFLTGNGLPALFDLPWMPIYLIAVFMLHPWLGVFGLCGAIALFVLALINQFTSRQLAPAVQEARNRSNQIMADVSRNSSAVTAMGMQSAMKQRWLGAHDDASQTSGALGKRAALFSSMTKTCRFIIQSGSLGLGAYLAVKGEISAGAMIAVSIILSRALSPVEQVIGNWRSLAMARFSIRRLRETLTTNPVATNPTELPLPTTRIEINNLAAAAPGTRSLVLKSVSMQLEAGDGVAVIGPSGAGKSSLAQVMVGIWENSHGEIRFDGAPLSQFSTDAKGAFIGYLPQTIELFEGTIAENICRFRDDATSEHIVAAAKLAGCHEMILALENGYDTNIGAAGQRLSGGQRQRVALARAVFGNPFVLVLDEPNSNLDNEGENALNSAIATMREAGSIVITIAHRPSALAAVNKVAAIQSGTLAAFGDKDHVMKQLFGEQRQGHAPALKAVNE